MDSQRSRSMYAGTAWPPSGQTVVCMRVPWKYLKEAPQARRHWLKRLHGEGGLVWLKGLPLSASGRSHAWVLVFKNGVP
jgi:hypothetical protein